MLPADSPEVAAGYGLEAAAATAAKLEQQAKATPGDDGAELPHQPSTSARRFLFSSQAMRLSWEQAGIFEAHGADYEQHDEDLPSGIHFS